MVPMANKMARLCPEAIGSARFPFVVAQPRSSAVAAMSTNAGRTVIPDSDSDGEPYYYSDINGEPYYYSDIDEVHKPSETSGRRTARRSEMPRLCVFPLHCAHCFLRGFDRAAAPGLLRRPCRDQTQFSHLFVGGDARCSPLP